MRLPIWAASRSDHKRTNAATASWSSQRIQAKRQIGASVAGKNVAFLKKCRDVGGKRAQAEAASLDEEMPDPRMNTEFVDRASVVGHGYGTSTPGCESVPFVRHHLVHLAQV